MSRPSGQTTTLPDDLTSQLTETLDDWRINGKVGRVWARDASLWTHADEGNWLGWLRITEDRLARIQHLTEIAEEVRKAGFSHALLLGMGGSSLCPEVLKMTFGKLHGYPELHILDSTDPAQIRAVERKVDLSRTVFIVSSKSGTTLEPNIFKQYFFQRAKEVIGAEEVGDRFIAITDPGSKLQQVAESDGFRHIFFGVPSIGGRYSALSDFGMVPAAVMGLDVRRFLDRADEMVHCCASCVPPEDNPGVVLGAILGVLARNGRDKVTLIPSPGIWGLGAWLEQLLAESTGKEGKGLIPVDREQVGPPEVYGADRVFVYVRLESAPDSQQDAAVAALEQARHPVVRIAVADPYDLGQEFFRWELATSVAGSILGINPFNQPDVETSKVATRKLTAEYEQTGSLPPEAPILREAGIRVFADAKNAASLATATGRDRSLVGTLRAHLQRLKAADYFALLAYVEMNAAYKGGPNTGVFVQITCDDAADLPVPGQKFTFGVVKAAQARGDFQVLAERNRRVLRLHLGADVLGGLRTLDTAIRQALA